MTTSLSRYTIEAMLDGIHNFYPAEDKGYHNIGHIKEMLTAMLDRSEAIEAYAGEDVYEHLIPAILYHDACYNPADVFPEIEACAVYKRAVAAPDIKVMDLILSTRYWKDPSYITNPLLIRTGDVLHDLDWMGFSDWVLFERNDAHIMREYVDMAGKPVEDVRTARDAFYKDVLDFIFCSGGRLYRTNILNDPDRDDADKRAVTNILRHLCSDTALDNESVKKSVESLIGVDSGVNDIIDTMFPS